MESTVDASAAQVTSEMARTKTDTHVSSEASGSIPANIKREPGTTPQNGTPLPESRKPSVPALSLDTDTLRAMSDLKKDELGLRSASREVTTPSSPHDSAHLKSATNTKPQNGGVGGTTTVKRKTPAKPSTVAKKGVTKSKAPAKKTKGAGPAGPLRSTSPASMASKSAPGRVRSKTGTPATGSSPVPRGVSEAPTNATDVAEGDEDDDGDEDDEIFCICRRPDDHKWMIGCDGVCEDWFHGKCVKLREADANLIEKYICPNCEGATGTQTTYKPMCRRETCRQPARVITKRAAGKQGIPQERSKYCSDGCGEAYMRDELARTEAAAAASREVSAKAKQTSRKSSTATAKTGVADLLHFNGAPDSYQEDLGPRGGPIRSTELKALIQNSADDDVAAFRRLGDDIDIDADSDISLSNPDSAFTHHMTPTERHRLTQIEAEKSKLRARRALIKDRERFITAVKERAIGEAASQHGFVGKAVKDFCGYDHRLAWNDAEFARWIDCCNGAAQLDSGNVNPEQRQQAKPNPRVNGVANGEGEAEEAAAAALDADGDTNMEPRADTNAAENADMDPVQICIKKRCKRHEGWHRQQLQEARFEAELTAEAMRCLETEQRDLRQRAVIAGRRARAVAAAAAAAASASSTMNHDMGGAGADGVDMGGAMGMGRARGWGGEGWVVAIAAE